MNVHWGFNDGFDWQQWIPILAPILLLQLALAVIALVICWRSERTNGPKWLWTIIILFFQIIGPVIFFIFGRRDQ